jgi:hypothetical protein
MVSDREIVIRKFIKDHPNLSGNKIYEQTKNSGFGINKQKFYKIYREVRKVPEPTKTKRIKSIPLKYRKPKHEKELKKEEKKKEKIEKKDPEKRKLDSLKDKVDLPKKDGQYGLIEVYDKTQKTSRWIKYYSQSDIERQLDILEESDKSKGFISNFKFIPHGIRTLQEFITEEFLSFV